MSIKRSTSCPVFFIVQENLIKLVLMKPALTEVGNGE